MDAQIGQLTQQVRDQAKSIDALVEQFVQDGRVADANIIRPILETIQGTVVTLADAVDKLNK